MDIEEWSGNKKKGQETFNFNALPLVGVLLLLPGIIVSLWVVTVVYNIFTGTEPIAILQTLAPADVDAKTLLTPAGSVVLPDVLFQITGYFICLFLLGICSRIGVGLVKHGVHILQPQNELLLKKIKEVVMSAMNSDDDSAAR